MWHIQYQEYLLFGILLLAQHNQEYFFPIFSIQNHVRILLTLFCYSSLSLNYLNEFKYGKKSYFLINSHLIMSCKWKYIL